MVFVGGNLTSVTFPGVRVRGTGINWYTHLKQQLNLSTAHAAHKRPPASHPKDPLSLAKVIDVQAPIGPTAEEEVGRGCVTSRRERKVTLMRARAKTHEAINSMPSYEYVSPNTPRDCSSDLYQGGGGVHKMTRIPYPHPHLHKMYIHTSSPGHCG